jgi:predicted nucleic acid-binding protein
MKRRIYLDTTVVSYFTANASRDLVVAARQKLTRELWPALTKSYDTYISALVYEEAGRGNRTQAKMRLEAIDTFSALAIDEQSRLLARKIIVEKGIPREYPEDALHVAVAAVNGMEVLLTWNFAHLNNPFTRLLVRRAVEMANYRCPEICSPEQLLEGRP